jgi:hypothetical protein
MKMGHMDNPEQAVDHAKTGCKSNSVIEKYGIQFFELALIILLFELTTDAADIDHYPDFLDVDLK